MVQGSFNQRKSQRKRQRKSPDRDQKCVGMAPTAPTQSHTEPLSTPRIVGISPDFSYHEAVLDAAGSLLRLGVRPGFVMDGVGEGRDCRVLVL